MVVIVDVTKPDALDRLEGYASQGAVGVRLAPLSTLCGRRPSRHLAQGRRAWARDQQYGGHRQHVL